MSASSTNGASTTPGFSRDEMAALAAADIADGSYVNLGIGLPEKVAQHLSDDIEVILHTENGLLGMGPAAADGEGDPELINAGKKRVTALPGAAYFNHADSFAMIRGGHLDVSLLGALEVAANGDLANWSTGGDAIPAVGGAMDLVAGVKSVRVMTSHLTRQGVPKLGAACAFPLTGLGVVSRVYTDLAVLDVLDGAFVVRRLADGVTMETVIELTAAPVVDGRGPDGRNEA